MHTHWSPELHRTAREPLHSVSPANWGPLNNTGQKLLSQWVVIDFTSQIEARFPLLSNEPAAPSLPMTPLIARWRYSPSVPSERSAFPVRPPSPPAPDSNLLIAPFPFIASFTSSSLSFLCRQLPRSSLFRRTFNPAINHLKSRHSFAKREASLNITVPFWRACLHLCVQLCRCHSAVYGSHCAAPPMQLFVLVD